MAGALLASPELWILLIAAQRQGKNQQFSDREKYIQNFIFA